MRSASGSPAWAFLLSFALVGIGATQPARAEFLTVSFTGTVTSTGAGLESYLGVPLLGAPLSGSYTFESTTPAQDPTNPNFASYYALRSLTFTVGNYSAS